MIALPASINLSRNGTLACIEIANPDRHNAMTLGMWRDLAGCFDTIAAWDVRCVILQGAGTRAFVSGADLSRFDEERAGGNGAQNYERAVELAVAAIEHCPLPTIASIGGICYGGGMMIAAACDFRIASNESRFCIPAARLGLAYPRHAVERLVNLVGPSQAKRMLMTARPIDAAEALATGFIDECVDPEMRLHAVQRLAANLATNAPLAVRAAKMAVDHVIHALHDAASVDAAVALCAQSEDHREGTLAFAEKRAPIFTGR